MKQNSEHYQGKIETRVKKSMVYKHLEGIFTADQIDDLGNGLKYFDRLGLKDDIEQDSFKAADYFCRLINGKWIKDFESYVKSESDVIEKITSPEENKDVIFLGDKRLDVLFITAYDSEFEEIHFDIDYELKYLTASKEWRELERSDTFTLRCCGILNKYQYIKCSFDKNDFVIFARKIKTQKLI